jgi:glycerol-3-phosphate dehydrogenase
VIGGKLTTSRRVSEEALAKLSPAFPALAPAWTARAALPGGDLGGLPFARWRETLVARYPGFPPGWIEAIAARHGDLARTVLGEARTPEDLGEHYGAGLTRRELEYLVRWEWAREADDVLWRRTKVGLHLSAEQRQVLAKALRAARADPAANFDPA